MHTKASFWALLGKRCPYFPADCQSICIFVPDSTPTHAFIKRIRALSTKQLRGLSPSQPFSVIPPNPERERASVEIEMSGREINNKK